MPDQQDQRAVASTKWLLSALTLAALIAFAIWAAPRKSLRFVPADDNITWETGQLPTSRSMIWRPPVEVGGLLPDELQNALLATPRFTAGGTVLYCSVRRKGGPADIYRSRLAAGQWQELQSVAELNGDADDLAAVVSRDEQHLYFYSNRDGGFGGFDLYVCSREQQGWSVPRNLGPRINTPADEYDPAISTDGRTLFFASNRTKEMAEQAAAATKDSEEVSLEREPRRRGLTHSDLYAAIYNGEGSWNAADPLVDVNLTESDETSPFLSPDGTHLYFASSRLREEGGKRSLDIYVSRKVGHQFRPPQNLGDPINTDEDELEPALSPEGFTLIFTSNRAGSDAIYTSRPIQIYEEVLWDTSHLAALQEVWGMALLVTLGAMVVVAAGLRLRGWFVEAATQAKFFMASVLFHLALLMVLAFWSLPTVIEVIVSQIQEAEAATQPFDDNQHQSHEDGQQAWEKLADLAAVDKTVDLVRRETEPINVPNETEMLEPTIPIEMARLLPSDRVLYTPPNEAAEIQEPQKLSKRAMASPSQSIDVAEVAEDIVLQATEVPELAAAPAKPVEIAKAVTDAALPRLKMTELAEPARLRPLDFEPAEPSELPSLNAPPEQIAATREASTEVRQVVEITEDAVAQVVPMSQTNELPAELKEEIQLARATLRRPAPQAAEPAEIQPPRSLTPTAGPVTPDLSEAKPTEPAASTARAKPMVVEAPDLETTEAPVELDAPKVAQTEPSGPTEASVELNRADVEPPSLEVPTPRELTGPDRGHRRVIVGELSDKRVDLPPSFGPIVSRLERPRAKAKKVVYAADSVGLQEMFTLRQSDIRKQYIELFDGTQDSEKAVNHGLVWLVTHQNANGSWSLNDFHVNCKDKHPNCAGAGTAKSNTAATGLALLPLLASGNTHQAGEYQQQVAAAIKWLQETQKENGDLLADGDQQRMYSHSIASIALCEAYGMTQDPELKSAVDKALDFIVKAQHVPTGGWRYNPNEAADTSVVGWAMMALKSAEMAGIAVPKATMENVAKWLAKVEGNKPVGGMFGYQNASVTPAMTAEGLLCLQFMDAGRNDARMLAGADYLLKNLPEPDQKRTSYYWYYGTQVMYHMQGQYWETWNGRLRDHLVTTQVKDGPLAGTWDPKDNWEKAGGRVYTTAMKLLMLEVYYRHLPLYEQLED